MERSIRQGYLMKRGLYCVELYNIVQGGNAVVPTSKGKYAHTIARELYEK